ncbi:MAG: hypothetical protein F6K26_17010 [Moorea sp. SIO2I5]|nr:hypothetical protein [Moorena sp. SIO2I5]
MSYKAFCSYSLLSFPCFLFLLIFSLFPVPCSLFPKNQKLVPHPMKKT